MNIQTGGGTWSCEAPLHSSLLQQQLLFQLTQSLSGFGSISGKSSDRDELFLNQISKGFGTSVLSCNMKCRFLLSIYIWIDINECLKKITISTLSLAIWFPFVCLMLMQIVLIVWGNPTWCQSPCWGWEVLRGKVVQQNISCSRVSRVSVSVLPVW